jgi:hypothetical protein
MKCALSEPADVAKIHASAKRFPLASDASRSFRGWNVPRLKPELMKLSDDDGGITKERVYNLHGKWYTLLRLTERLWYPSRNRAEVDVILTTLIADLAICFDYA